MKMAAGRAPGRAHAADLLAAGDVLAGRDEHHRHVAVTGRDALAMVDLDEVAIAARIPPGAKHGAVGGGVDWRADRAGKVDPGVHRSACGERVRTNTEARGEGGGADRLFGRDGDHAILKAVELLPAREQGLEHGVGLHAFERSAFAGLAKARRGQAEALEFGGGDLVANVKRAGDEGGLLQLGGFDAGERADADRPIGGGKRAGVELAARQRGFDQGLALLDLAGAGFGCGRKGGGDGRGVAGQQLRHRKTRESDEREHGGKEHHLDRHRQAQAAERRSIVDEHVPIAKQLLRNGQHSGHRCSKLVRRGESLRRLIPIARSSPAPLPNPSNCPSIGGPHFRP